MIHDLSNLPLVAAVGAGSPDAKRPRPDEEAGPSDAIAPTEGRWWPVNADGTFRVSVSVTNRNFGSVLSILADPARHALAAAKTSHPEDPVNYLWDKATLIEERSLGQGQPVAAIYTTRPNIKVYVAEPPLEPEKQVKLQDWLEHIESAWLSPSDKEQEIDGVWREILGKSIYLRDRVLIHAFGANKTSLPATRVPDEIHLIVNLLTPNPGGCGWCTMAVGVVPVPADDEGAQMERLGALMASCPFVDVDVERE